MEVKDAPVSYQGPADSETKPEEMEAVPIPADDSKCSSEGEVSETSALPGSYQAPTDSEVRDVESFTESKEIEEVLVTLGMSNNDDTRVSGEILSSVSVDQKVEADADASVVVDDDENQGLDDTEEEEEEEEDDDDDDDDIVSGQAPRVAILDSSGTAKQIIKEMEEVSSSTS